MLHVQPLCALAPRTLSGVLCSVASWCAPKKKRQAPSPSIFSHSSSRFGDDEATGCTQ